MSFLEKSIETGGLPGCSIAAALDLVGERWSLLVLRDLNHGVTRFNDLRATTGAPRESLKARLRDLETAGLITRHRYNEHPPRDEYLLTHAGKAIEPVLTELHNWGEAYAFDPAVRGGLPAAVDQQA